MSTPLRLCLGLAALGLATSGAVALAEDPGAAVVARVGPVHITAAELRWALDHTHPAELYLLGKTNDERRRALLEQLVGKTLLLKGADDEKLGELPEVRGRTQRVLIEALQEAVRREAVNVSVTEEEVRAFYQEHLDRYRSELRIKLWQIVVGTKDEADKLLATILHDPEYQKSPVDAWEKLAREHSLDKTSYMRKGNVGFVQADGSTPNLEIKVDAALYKAALEVKDGEVVPHPVAVGNTWVVLQRRGSHQTPERTLQTEAPTIRAELSRQQAKRRFEKLLAELRRTRVSEIHTDRLEHIAISPAGELGVAARPGSLRRHAPAEHGPPVGRPGHLR